MNSVKYNGRDVAEGDVPHGPQAGLYDLLVRRVARLVVSNPRQNALMKSGNKSHAIDARKLAELLRARSLSPVYHGEQGTATGVAAGLQVC